MSTVNSKVVKKIAALIKPEMAMKMQNMFRQTLRQLLHIFGNFYYINDENEIIRVKCIHANPERAISKFFQENNIILPIISIGEASISTDNDRQRYTPMLVHEKYWSDEKQRAIRILSLTPKPVKLTYAINIWAEYKYDLDQLREQMFSSFNPDLEVKTEFSDITKAFIIDESDISEYEVGDTQDRLVRKTIEIEIQTYIPNPKFMYTSTGEIEEFHTEFEIMENDSLTEIEVKEGLNIEI